MKLEKLISISGMPGLFKMVGQMKNGIVVESLTDGKRFPAFATHKISALDDISIYGESDDIPLSEVFDKLFEKTEGKAAMDHNSSGAELTAFFGGFLPDYDQDRVYQSDMKKVLKWFNLLLEKDMLLPNDEASDEDAEEAEDEAVAEEASAEASTEETPAEDSAEKEGDA